jgi:hypothetical protein
MRSTKKCWNVVVIFRMDRPYDETIQRFSFRRNLIRLITGGKAIIFIEISLDYIN